MYSYYIVYYEVESIYKRHSIKCHKIFLKNSLSVSKSYSMSKESEIMYWYSCKNKLIV